MLTKNNALATIYLMRIAFLPFGTFVRRLSLGMSMLIIGVFRAPFFSLLPTWASLMTSLLHRCNGLLGLVQSLLDQLILFIPWSLASISSCPLELYSWMVGMAMWGDDLEVVSCQFHVLGFFSCSLMTSSDAVIVCSVIWYIVPFKRPIWMGSSRKHGTVKVVYSYFCSAHSCLRVLVSPEEDALVTSHGTSRGTGGKLCCDHYIGRARSGDDSDGTCVRCPALILTRSSLVTSARVQE